MTTPLSIDAATRERLLASPELVLDDQDLMRALIAANEQTMGANVVDLRGIAMERLEARLDRLEDTHRSVIAAAYENLAGMNQIHRAVLRLLEAERFEDFLGGLAGDVAQILRVDAMRLVLESLEGGDDPALQAAEKTLCIVPQGSCAAYTGSNRPVILRQTDADGAVIFGEAGADIRSEACLRLDLGEGRLPALLVMGSEDPHLFNPQQGTDLLTFFAGVFERSLHRWLG